MFSNFPLFPQQASTVAGEVDALYFFVVAIAAFFSLLIAALIAFFAVRYRRRHPGEVGAAIHGSLALELVWTAIPFVIAMVIFGWGASVYFKLYRAPRGAIEIYAVGKQWMWKFQHLDGQREINELHVPVGRSVRITMGSEDVIHSLFIPAFRVKMDVVPGRATTLWFQATKPGKYHLFCTEYCGTKHSGMIGWVYAMEPAAFQSWLSGGGTGESLAASGAKLFQSLACHTCHQEETQGRGPVLKGLFGKPVALAGGATVIANEDYLRESIVNPQAKIVQGFQPLMPTFQGLISEEGLMQLIAYVKSLSPPPEGAPAPAAPAPPPGAAPVPPAAGKTKEGR
jgi:cytochrome c oxidase subunit 2